MFPLIKLQSISFMLHRSSCREMKQILLATNNEMTGLKSMGKVSELKKNIKNQKHQNTFEGAVLDGGLHGGCVSLSRKEWRFFCFRSILSCLSFFS